MNLSMSKIFSHVVKLNDKLNLILVMFITFCR